MNNFCIIQCCQSIIETLFAVIMTMIVGCIYRFYRTGCQNRSIRCRCFECKCFILTCCGICKSSFEICNCQIIGGENAFYILKKIVSTVIFVISIQAGAVIKCLICSQSTVSYNTECERYRRIYSCFGFGSLRFNCPGFGRFRPGC